MLYHQFAWSYDYVASAVSLGKWNSWVKAVLPYLTGETVLELGHGPGHLQSMLCSMDKTSIGLDESANMNRQAYHRLRQNGYEPLLINGYAQSVPFDTSAFDHVVATFPTEFIFQQETLNEIWRVLTPGGSLVVLPVAVPTGGGSLNRLAAALFRTTQQAPPSFDEGTLDKIASPFRNFGFETTVDLIKQRDSHLVILIAKTTSLNPPLPLK